jgi:hypothetical protein
MRHCSYLRRIGFAASLAAVCLLGFACSDDDDAVSPPVAQAPEIPPQSTFIMNFSDYEDQAEAPSAPGSELSRINWGQSALRIGFWNLALTVTLAVPAAAFVEAFNHEPIMLGDSSWEWSYSVVVASAVHTCRLNGKVVDDDVQWRMYITKVGEYSDYLWYSGSHDLGATEGTWTVNRHPDEVNPFIGIEWHRNPVNGTGDLKYTNIIPEHEENGGYIYYGSTSDPDNDRFYRIYNKGEDNLAEIEWNSSTKAGRVKDEFFYGDQLWHCWDENLDDVDCP